MSQMKITAFVIVAIVFLVGCSTLVVAGGGKSEYRVEIPSGKFVVLFNEDGTVYKVAGFYRDAKGNLQFNPKWRETELRFKSKLLIEDFKGLHLLKVSASPGNWCVIDGRRRRCP